MANLDRKAVRQGIVKDGQRYFPEESLLGSGKHGLEWTEGRARAIDTGTPQGQFGSLEDVYFAVQKGAEIGTGQHQTSPLPPEHSCIIHMPDGSVVTATQIFVKVYFNGKVHAYPLL